MPTDSMVKSALAAFALAAVTLSAQAALPRYTAVDLSSIGSQSVYGAHFINEAGQIAGSFVPSRPLFYTPGGSFVPVNDLTGMTGVTRVHDLSDAGHLVGVNDGTAYIYTPGLGVQYTPGRSIVGVNGSGHYVGQLQEGNFGGYRFTPGEGYSMVPGEPVRINEAGDVLFRAGPATGIQRSDGSIVDIGSLGRDVYVADINDRGDVVGLTRTASGLGHAFLYTAEGGLVDLDTFGRTEPEAGSMAHAMNNHGVVVGDYGDGMSFNGFLADGSGMYDIESLLDPISANQWQITSVTDINDAGQIIGQGQFNGRRTTFLLNPVATPVPEPAAVLLTLAGVPLIAWCARRRRERSAHGAGGTLNCTD